MIISESSRQDATTAAMSDFPVNSEHSNSSCSSPTRNGGNNNAGDFCKGGGGSRRKQSKPSRVSTAEGGGSRELQPHAGGDGTDCRSRNGECHMLPAAEHKEPSATISAVPYDLSAADSSSSDVVNYPCHQCSKTFSTLILREQHVHKEHASENGRGGGFPTAYHQLANELAHASAAAMAVAAMSKNREPSSALTPYSIPTSQIAATRAMPLSAGFSPAVFHPEAYCDICQREFCNKYFLKTHRANIHGIYTTDAASAVGSKDKDCVSSPAAAALASAESQKESPAVPQKDSAGTIMAGAGVTYACEICHKPFSSRLYVKKHLMNVHGVMFLPVNPGSDAPTSDIVSSWSLGWPDGGALMSAPQPVAKAMQHQRALAAQRSDSDHQLDGSRAGEQLCTALTGTQSLGLPPQQRSPLCLSMASRAGDSPHDMSNATLEDNAKQSFIRTSSNSRISSSSGICFGNNEGDDNTNAPEQHHFTGDLGSGCDSRDHATALDMSVPSTNDLEPQAVEQQQLQAGGTDCMEWDDAASEMFRSSMAGRRESGMGRSPARKQKALESLFGHGPESFFDAAMAVRMADRIACDICGKEVCNKYFLKAHKVKMHGVMESSTPHHPPLNERSSDEGGSACRTEPIAAGEAVDKLSPRQGAAVEPSAASYTTTARTSPVSKDFSLAEKTLLSAADGPSIEGLLAMGIDPEAYCSICKKEFCSKYFLRTHKLNMHGIMADGRGKLSPRNVANVSNEVTSLATATTLTTLSRSSSPDPSATASMVVGEIYKQWRWKEPANQTRVFCDICNKELCNKYFLRTHKLNKHGIATTPDSVSMTGSPYCPTTAGRHRTDGGSGSRSPVARSNGGMPAPFQLLSPSQDHQASAEEIATAGCITAPGTDAAAAAAAISSLPSAPPFYTMASSRGSPAISASSAVASSRILGLKFELERMCASQKPRCLSDCSQQQPQSNSCLQPSFSDAWSLLQSTTARSAMLPPAPNNAGNSTLPCNTCGMLFSNHEELSRHCLHNGHQITSMPMELHQNSSYNSLKREATILDASSAPLRQMSMAFLMGSSHQGKSMSSKQASGGSSEKLYSCSRCDYKTPWLSNIYSHEQRKHGGSGGARGRSTEVHTCGVCLRTFSYEHSLMRHVTEYHGGAGLAGDGSSQTTVATSAAPVSAVKTESSHEEPKAKDGSSGLAPESQALRAPAFSAPKRRSRCPYCSKQFVTKYLCQSHIRHSHGVCTGSTLRSPAGSLVTDGDHGTMYACSMCKFTCRMLSNLRMHQAIKHKISSGGLPNSDSSEPQRLLSAELHVKQSNSPVEAFDDNSAVSPAATATNAVAIPVDQTCSSTEANGCQPVLMQPFRIMGILGGSDFAPTTVYLPVYKKVKGDAQVTFTLRSVEN